MYSTVLLLYGVRVPSVRGVQDSHITHACSLLGDPRDTDVQRPSYCSLYADESVVRESEFLYLISATRPLARARACEKTDMNE